MIANDETHTRGGGETVCVCGHPLGWETGLERGYKYIHTSPRAIDADNCVTTHEHGTITDRHYDQMSQPAKSLDASPEDSECPPYRSTWV